MFFLNFLLFSFVILLTIPVLVLLLQVVAAVFSKSIASITTDTKVRPPIAILMPAHNESLVITSSIESIQAQLQVHDELIVIADNCTDETASIAKKLGATVIERFNEKKRGKGYALDFGLQYLKAKPPELVLIVDADCHVNEDAITALVSSCIVSQRPIQALYLMETQPTPSLKARVAAFAWLVKNKVRPLGFNRLGLPCQLMGTGMAFLWSDINKVNLASGHIVEDMKLGADLARLNKAPLFLNDAVVTSIFPPSETATSTQRSRWEHGHLSVIVSEVPKLILEAVKTRNVQMLGLACDLLIPPLAMLTLMCLVALITSIFFGNNLILTLVIGLSLALLLAVLLAWLKFGREVISFRQLCYAPIYALIKIPLYLKFFWNRQIEWVRSKRD